MPQTQLKCLKCGQQHITTSCQKNPALSAKYTNSDADHLTDTTSCPVYIKKLQDSTEEIPNDEEIRVGISTGIISLETVAFYDICQGKPSTYQERMNS